MKITTLRNALQNFKKGNLLVRDYIRRIKKMYDTLLASGQQLTKEKLINFLLDGLGPEFELIIAIIITNLASSIEKMSLADVKLSL